jgi:hypothetical protein
LVNEEVLLLAKYFNVDALVKTSATADLQQTLGISKDAIVISVSTPLIQSVFNLSP